MRKGIFLIFLFAVMACADNSRRKGSRPMPKDEFTEILLQAYIMEGDKNSRLKAHSDRASLARYVSPMDTLLAHYRISRDSFEYAYDWYIADKAEMDSIYGVLLRQLAILKDKVANGEDTLLYRLPLNKKFLQFSNDSLTE